MKIFSFFSLTFLIFIFSACNNNLDFGVSQKYILFQNEKQLPLDQLTVDIYESLINIDTLNVPINKFLKGTNYKVYIGVSFFNSTQKLFDIYSKDSSFSILSKKITPNDISMFFLKNGKCFYSHIYDSKNDKFAYVLTMDADSLVVKTNYDTAFFSKKIIKN